MASIPQMSRGKTVYSQGSFAPTRGRVSGSGVQGYINRERRKPKFPNQPGGVSRIGGDGKSDTRSGLARKALSGRISASSPGLQGFDTSSLGLSKLPGSQLPVLPSSGVPTAAPNLGFPSIPGANSLVTPPAPPSAISVNSSGQLELPYDPAWNDTVLSSLEESNAALAELQMESQTQALEYAKGKRDLDLGYQDAKRSTLNRNAGAGTAFSSAYGYQMGKDAQGNLNASNDLDAANTAFANSVAMRRSQITNAFNSQLQKAVSDYAAQLAEEQAGTLGYGTTPGNAGPKPPGGGGGKGGKGKGDGKGGKGKGKPGPGWATPPNGWATPNGGKRPLFNNTGRPGGKTLMNNGGRPLTAAQKALRKGKK